MGELIRVDFKNKKIREDEFTGLEAPRGDSKQENFKTVLEFLEYFNQQALAKRSTNFGALQNLPFSESTFGDALDIVDKYTDKQLIDLLMDSTERD